MKLPFRQNIVKPKEQRFYKVFWKFKNDNEESELAKFFESEALNMFSICIHQSIIPYTFLGYR